MHKRAILPNLFTLGNLFLGFSAILIASQGRYLTASWLIVVAGIFDGLDGTIARLVHSDSDFGREIDSLVDTVSFGVAPSLIIYKVVFETFGLIGIVMAFLPLVAGILRLARYNVTRLDGSGPRVFFGIPITAAALILVNFNIYTQAIYGGVANQLLWFSLTPAVSLLMISTVPYRPLPGIRIHGSKHPYLAVTVLIITALVIIWNPALTLFPLGLVYLISGPIEWVIVQTRKVGSTESDEDLNSQPALSNRGANRQTRRRKR